LIGVIEERASEMLIRKGTIEDIDQIVAWQISMAKETENLDLNHATVTAGVCHIMANESIGEYRIAIKDGIKVGCLLRLYEWSDWRAGFVIWIHSVYVEPSYRRQGVFAAMYDNVRSDVMRDGLWRGIRLYVDKTNGPAQSSYRKLGMTDQHYHMFEWMKEV
jgi:ribosomal protein S18 acetylase RimI-like enzyme